MNRITQALKIKFIVPAVVIGLLLLAVSGVTVAFLSARVSHDIDKTMAVVQGALAPDAMARSFDAAQLEDPVFRTGSVVYQNGSTVETRLRLRLVYTWREINPSDPTQDRDALQVPVDNVSVAVISDGWYKVNPQDEYYYYDTVMPPADPDDLLSGQLPISVQVSPNDETAPLPEGLRLNVVVNVEAVSATMSDINGWPALP